VYGISIGAIAHNQTKIRAIRVIRSSKSSWSASVCRTIARFASLRGLCYSMGVLDPRYQEQCHAEIF
jgi:hypothetical protein